MPATSTRLAIAALRCLPTHLLSRLAGRAAAWRLPPRLQAWEIRRFARAAGVNFDEVRDPLGSFRCLQDFFVRALKDGVRPIDPAPDALVAPCDGAWGTSGIVEDGTLLQVKGRPYSLAALLGDAGAARGFERGAYATFYLSPRDYHRFHAPCAVRVAQARYVPGALWPVNRIGVEGVDGLFAANERLCAFMTAEIGRAALCLVAVGATLVGKVRVTFDDLTTNRRGAQPVTHTYGAAGPRFGKGEEWGRFEFGSTIVVIAAPGLVAFDTHPPGTPVRLGQRIGTLRGALGA